MSKYYAYPFLYDDASDLKCDFEILTDEISSMIGFLRSLLDEKDKNNCLDIADDLSKINELMYHINPSLRTKVTVKAEELGWLYGKTESLQKAVEKSLPKICPENQDCSTNETCPENPDCKPAFFLPQGCTQAALAHVIRNKCKALVRLLSRYKQQGNPVDEILFDYTNLYSGYFYSLALWFNKNHDKEEQLFISRVY
jgi:cob(I)alamin adenosyltransferase